MRIAYHLSTDLITKYVQFYSFLYAAFSQTGFRLSLSSSLTFYTAFIHLSFFLLKQLKHVFFFLV